MIHLKVTTLLLFAVISNILAQPPPSSRPPSSPPPSSTPPSSSQPSSPPPSSTNGSTSTTKSAARTATINTTGSTTATTTTKSGSSSLNPIITNWITTKTTGYSGYQANVLKIYYDTSNVYISSNSIPSYSIGSWKANPNVPKPQNWTYALPLSPSSASTKRETMMGPIGFWTNGMGMYNAKDGYSYNNKSIWNRNAYFWEYVSFDNCSGHPDGSGTYHNHVRPTCMFTESSTSHSPIIGWAWDGYPVYGTYGYSSANSSTSGIKKLASSYKLRSITDRSILPNNTVLATADQGPPINATYPLGSYLEDYEYSAGYGDLDQYNGRWCATPEYPSGIYAYFLTTNSSNMPVYPYTPGPSFYGQVRSISLYQTVPTGASVYYSYV